MIRPKYSFKDIFSQPIVSGSSKIAAKIIFLSEENIYIKTESLGSEKYSSFWYFEHL